LRAWGFGEHERAPGYYQGLSRIFGCIYLT
jgi:hypothetical protein